MNAFEVSQLRDYSVSGGAGDQTFEPATCANVKVVEASEGIIRSPFYYKPAVDNQTSLKCKWTLIGPADQAFELT